MKCDYLICLGNTTSYLYDWARTKDVNDFKLGMPPWNEVGIQNTFPEPVRFDIDDAAVLVGVGYSFHGGSRAAGVTATSSIGITPRTPLKARAIAGKFVQRFCDLLSFATDRPNAVEEVALTQTKDTGISKEHHLLYDRIFRLKDERSGLYEGDMLFSLNEAIEMSLNIFQEWLNFTNKHTEFCTVYFASLYAQPRYLDEKFQRLISAFTLLCGSLSEPTPPTIQFVEDMRRTFDKSFTDKDRLLLYHLLPTLPKVQMTLDMRRLLEEHARLMGQVISDFDEFVMAVSATLRYIETREEPQGYPKLEAAELHYAMQKTRMLIKILVLGQLGFDENRVASFIERNKDFLHIKAQKS
jgi:ApeA N-terminal domain 1